jgi:hypothetical protein
MALSAPIVIGCIDYLAYGTIIMCAMFLQKIKLDVFFFARKVVDACREVVCDPAQVTIFGEPLSKKYGVAVTTHRGKVHDYLSMILDFSPKGKVMVMMEYIKNIIKTSRRRS